MTRPGARRLVVVGSTAALALVLSGCSTSDIPAMLDIPQPVTKQGEWIHSLWQGSWVAAWAVGAITWGLIIWAVIAYRKRSNDPPAQTRYNLPIEIMYTVVPFFILAVLFFYTQRDESRITAVSAHPQNTVNVVAFRWNWTFNYIDENVYDIGSPAQLPTLYLPVNQTVKFTLTSPDVIHSFWVPAFLFKLDVIPGRTNVFEITPTKIGTYPGRCAELCGVDHSRMLFQVKVVSEQDYAQHIADLKAAGQLGLLNTGRVSDQANGDKQGYTQIGGNP
jgi:cytochrome c oxidase subunit II